MDGATVGVQEQMTERGLAFVLGLLIGAAVLALLPVVFLLLFRLWDKEVELLIKMGVL